METRVFWILLTIHYILVDASVDFEYHNYKSMTRFLKGVATKHSDLAHLYSIGKSVAGRNLWVISLAGTSPEKHVFRRPEVKYVANIHGNEAVSREMMIHFVDYFVTQYGRDEAVTKFMDTTRLHIMVSMNPDGFEFAYRMSDTKHRCYGLNGRYNINHVDLNRNFPDIFRKTKDEEQDETKAVRKWLKSEQFILSGNLHGGALVVNYPYDNSKSGSATYSATPDDDVFRNIAKIYADSHPIMHLGSNCGEHFKNGITNGVEWYSVPGGMSDYNYVKEGCMEFTIEMSCCKYPDASTLTGFWDDHKNPLMLFLQQAHIGVKGVVKDQENFAIDNANIAVVGRTDFTIKTTHLGEYWRLVLPGEYVLKVEAYGFHTKMEAVNVTVTGPTVRDIILERDYSISLNRSKAIHIQRYESTPPSILSSSSCVKNRPMLYVIGTFCISFLLSYLQDCKL